MFEIEHNGFLARLSVVGDLIRGDVRDTHEPLIVEGRSISELKNALASKIEEYCLRCHRRGISRFTTPDGKSTVETEKELLGSDLSSGLIDASQRPPEWPHKHHNFFSSKAALLQDQIESLKKGDDKIPRALRLPIDDVVDRLRERTRPPSLADVWRKPPHNKDLARFVRQRLSMAFDRVAVADPRNYQYRRDSAFEFLGYAERLTKEATEFLHRYGGDSGVPTFSRGLDRNSSNEHFETAELAERGLGIFLERLHKLMSWAYADLDDLAPAHGGRPRLIWKYDFVGAVADLWKFLTAKKPSPKPHGRFIELVDAAWRSGGDDMPPVSWDRTVREFCNGAREGDEASRSQV